MSGEQPRGGSQGSAAIDTPASNACVRTDASSWAGFMKSSNFDLFIRSWTPLTWDSGISKPITAPIGSVDGSTEYRIHFQPARWRTMINLLINAYSAAGSAATPNGISANGFTLAMISSACSSVMTRGVIFFSSCANFSSASLVRALASAACASDIAILSSDSCLASPDAIMVNRIATYSIIKPMAISAFATSAAKRSWWPRKKNATISRRMPANMMSVPQPVALSSASSFWWGVFSFF